MSANAFNYSNKVRKAWASRVTGTKLDVTFAYLDRDIKFETFAEIDRDVHDKVIQLMRDHYNDMVEQGNVTKICTLGKQLLTKECHNGVEYYIEMAADLVVAEMISDLE